MSNIWSDNIWVVNYVHVHFFENSENLAFSWVNYQTVVINLNILNRNSFAVSYILQSGPFLILMKDTLTCLA